MLIRILHRLGICVCGHTRSVHWLGFGGCSVCKKHNLYCDHFTNE